MLSQPLFYIDMFLIRAYKDLTLSSDAQKVAFVLCNNEAQRNAQNKGRFLGQLQRLVMFIICYASIYTNGLVH